MQPTGLAQYYDMIKNGENPTIVNSDSSAFTPHIHHHPHIHHGHDDFDWKNKVLDNCNSIKNDCAKHIILDIYFKILPLDYDYKCRNMGMLKNDVDKMLKSKNMNASQYLTSCYEKTKAPLLRYIIRNIDEIGKKYLEDSSQDLVNNKNQNGIVQQSPEIKIPDNTEIESQIVPVKNDSEYSTFVEELKKKTVNKIVKDITGLINDKKEEKEISFNKPTAPEMPEIKNESTIIIGMDYLQKILWENVDIINSNQEELLGIAIRESTLNQLDIVFKQTGRYVEDFYKKIWKNKGVLINESVKDLFIEKA